MRGSAVFRTGVAPGGALAGPWVQNSLWTRARAVPSLDLRFADNKSLVDATTGANLVDFTRASSGTYVDSEGVIRTATTNLLLSSEDLTVSPWTIVGLVTVTADSSQGLPFTGASVYRVDYLSAPSEMAQPFTYLATNYTASVWVKGTAGETIRFSGQSTVKAENYTLTGEWQHLTQAWTATASAQTFNMNTSAGATARTIYVAAPQLEQSSTVGEYVPTTTAAVTVNTTESLGLLVEEQRTNLITSSSDIAGFFTEQNSTATADAAAAPDGTVTADLLVPNTSSSTHTSFNTSISFSASTTYSYSIFVKPNGYSWLQLLFTSGFNNLTAWVNFDLTGAGSFGFTGGGEISKEIESYPGGWYRCTITATSGASPFAGGPAYLVLDSNRNGRDANYAGDNTSGIYLWGAQLEADSFPTSYIPTSGTTATRAADVASISGSNFGVSRTNLVLRSEEFDNAAWMKARVTVTANAVAAPDGTTTAEKMIANTENDTHFLFQGGSFVSGVEYVFSVFAKKEEWDFIRLGFPSDRFAGSGRSACFDLNNGTVGDTQSGVTASIVNLNNGWYRCSIKATANSTGATITGVAFNPQSVDSAVSQSIAGDGTSGIYVWGAQLETGSTATAYIPTTTSAVTVVESPWYRQDEGTVFAEATPIGDNGSNQFVYALAQGTGIAEEIFLFKTPGTNSVTNAIRSSSSFRFSNGTDSLSPFGSNFKNAIGASSTSTSSAVNGVIQGLDTSVVMPTIDNLVLGKRPNNTFSGNFLIRRLTYWPARLPDETLQTITQ